MRAEDVKSSLEEKAEALHGEELKSEVEAFLNDSGIEYSVENISGLEQPQHKTYTYEVDVEGDSYELDVILHDGRPGNEDGSVELSEG